MKHNSLATICGWLLAGALLLAGCGSATTPAPTVPPEPTPTTAAPTAEVSPVETAQPSGGVDVAWEYVIEPQVPIVATVNGVEISAEAYLAELLQQLHVVTYQYGVDWNDEDMQALLPTFQDDILQQLIQEQLARQLAEAEGIVIDDAQLSTELASIQDDVTDSGEFESWDDFLAVMGSSPENISQQIITYLIFEALTEAHGGPAEAEQVHAAHILVDTEEIGNEVLQRLEAGESFADLAAEYSTDTSNKDQGGDLGWFPRTVMVPEFEDAAFALNPGETSGLVATDYGYHIIQVLGKEVRPLDADVLEQIRDVNFQNWFEAQIDSAAIETLVQFEEPSP